MYGPTGAGVAEHLDFETNARGGADGSVLDRIDIVSWLIPEPTSQCSDCFVLPRLPEPWARLTVLSVATLPAAPSLST